MDDKGQYHHLVSTIDKNIKYYNRMIALSNNTYERMFYERMLYIDCIRLNSLKHFYSSEFNNKQQQPIPMLSPGHSTQRKEFTLEELAQFNGSNGKPAYVAVNGIVYDVTSEATWGGGTHFSLYAGQDLTNQFTQCHSDRLGILKKLPEVGILKD